MRQSVSAFKEESLLTLGGVKWDFVKGEVEGGRLTNDHELGRFAVARRLPWREVKSHSPDMYILLFLTDWEQNTELGIHDQRTNFSKGFGRLIWVRDDFKSPNVRFTRPYRHRYTPYLLPD